MNTLDARRRLLGRNVCKRATEGNPAIAQGSLARRDPGITMQGWTEQDSTTGAQLLNFTENAINASGITYVSKGSIITVNGAKNNGDGGRLTYITSTFTLQPGTYIFSFEKLNDVNSAISGVFVTKKDGGLILDNNFIIEEETDVFIGANFFNGKTMNNTVIKCMLNEGSTALPWEPYTGRKPSPSPDYPQEIVSAGKYNEDTQKWEYEIKLTGANLIPEYFDESKWDKTSHTYWYIPVPGLKTGELYTFSTVLLPEAGLDIYVLLGSIAGEWNSGERYWLYHRSAEDFINESVTFEATQDTYYLNLFLDGESFDTFISLFPELMLELGDKRTTYEPYRTPQTVTLTADRPLTKWDRLEKRNGQWGWVYKSAEVVLDGSEDWGVYVAYEGFSVGYIFDTPRLRAEGFCESFICETAQYNVGKDTGLWLGVNNYSVYAIRIPQYNEELSDSGLQDWKDWLSENPITILTYADEETFVPLSPEEQEAMNALHTFRPTTVLSNDEGCEMSLTYKTKKSLEVAE